MKNNTIDGSNNQQTTEILKEDTNKTLNKPKAPQTYTDDDLSFNPQFYKQKMIEEEKQKQIDELQKKKEEQ